MGVQRDAAEDVTSPVERFVRWMPIGTGSPQPAAVLFLPCSLDTAYLYALANNDGKWHVADQLAFDCHYDKSVSVELAPVVTRKSDDVVVHHAGEGHGAGYSQQNFQIYHLSNQKLQLVLDTEEVVRVGRVGTRPMDEIQQSSFVAIPTSNSRPYLIEETRSDTTNGKLVVQRRRFRWSPSKKRYVPSKFLPVTYRNG